MFQWRSNECCVIVTLSKEQNQKIFASAHFNCTWKRKCNFHVKGSPIIKLQWHNCAGEWCILWKLWGFFSCLSDSPVCFWIQSLLMVFKFVYQRAPWPTSTHSSCWGFTQSDFCSTFSSQFCLWPTLIHFIYVSVQLDSHFWPLADIESKCL